MNAPTCTTDTEIGSISSYSLLFARGNLISVFPPQNILQTRHFYKITWIRYNINIIEICEAKELQSFLIKKEKRKKNKEVINKGWQSTDEVLYMCVFVCSEVPKGDHL